MLNRELRTWQFWIPRFGFNSYSLFYVPKIMRESLRFANYAVKLYYVGKGSFTFLIPRGILPFVVKNINLLLMVGDRSKKYLIKPYFTSFLIGILGLTFRFKLLVKVKGLGYKSYVNNSGKTLTLKLGLSHIVNFNFFRDMFASKLGQKDRMFSIEGSNWIILTNTLARIRSLRKIDYYRGKGIFKKFYNCKIRQSKKKKK